MSNYSITAEEAAKISAVRKRAERIDFVLQGEYASNSLRVHMKEEREHYLFLLGLIKRLDSKLAQSESDRVDNGELLTACG